MREAIVIAVTAAILGLMVFLRWRWLGSRVPNADLVVRVINDTLTMKGGGDEKSASVTDKWCRQGEVKL